MGTKARIEHSGVAWLVYYEDRLVGSFDLVGQALDLAELLETSPRQRLITA